MVLRWMNIQITTKHRRIPYEQNSTTCGTIQCSQLLQLQLKSRKKIRNIDTILIKETISSELNIE